MGGVQPLDVARCGSPPRIEDETIRRDLDVEARSVASGAAAGQFSSKYEQTRTDVFAKYPDGEKARSKAYFDYQICLLVLSDPSLTFGQRVEILDSLRPRERKTYTLIIARSGRWIDNNDIGSVDGSLSRIRISVGDQEIADYRLNRPSEHAEVRLPEGRHTFTFEADITTNAGLEVEDTCKGFIDLRGDTIVAPSISFDRRTRTRGAIRSCALTPR